MFEFLKESVASPKLPELEPLLRKEARRGHGRTFGEERACLRACLLFVERHLGAAKHTERAYSSREL